MAEKLTPQQEMAVVNRGGPLLVSAAAGSGKTKVLVDRLMGYLSDPVDPANLDDFLIITYTKAAASELRGKIAAKLTERIAVEPHNKHLQQQMQRLYLTKISTVHAFCADLLRENAYRLDLSADFRVGDENECRELRETAMQQVLDQAFARIGQDQDIRSFVDTQGLGRTDALVPEIVMKVYDSARCHLDPGAWLDECLANSNLDGVTDPAQTVWGKYLMDDLFWYLDLQIDAVSLCVEKLSHTEGVDKPLVLMKDTLVQLRHLRESLSWDDVVSRKYIEYGRLTFTKKCTDLELAEQVKAVRNACKKGLEKKLRPFTDPAEQVLKDLSGTGGAVRGMISLVNAFSKQYDAMKKRRRVLDFGDLEHRTLDLLLGKKRSGPTAAARDTGAQFREILVDEYQDSNGVQDAIFGTLTKERGNLFLVGDVKQSIYQFRLADPQIFLDKYAAYLPAEDAVPGHGRKVLLSSNFRSGGAVLSAVNDVFRTCMSPRVGGLEYGTQEAMNEGIPHHPLGDPEVELDLIAVREETYPEEAAFVAEQIRALLDGTHMVRQGDALRPIVPDDIVILLRSPGSVGSYFQSALERLGIRCSSGGGNDLLRTQEIQTLRSVLQSISNPRQDIPLIAALSSPVFGFTADDLARIRSRRKSGSFYDALLLDEHEKTTDFLAALQKLRMSARMEPLPKLMDLLLTLTRMDSIYGAMDGGEVKRSNLQYFFRMAVDFDSGGHRDLTQFLEHLDALEVKGIPGGVEQASGAVTIMSIHKSKGLEFPVVFLCGLSREFNRESLRAQVLCDQDLGIGLSCVDTKNRIRYPSISKRAIAAKTVQESLSEELRVLYVAMTRARDRLIMTYCSKNPESEVQDMSLRIPLSGKELMTGNVVCPGEWVLYEAMQRTEAGMLHALGGRPNHTHMGEYPWKIQVVDAPAVTDAVVEDCKQKPALPEHAVEALKSSLAFCYGHADATRMASKLTATALKGREKDQEAAEHTNQSVPRPWNWRIPSFRDQERKGTAYGNAVHKLLQFIRFEACGSSDGVRREIERLTVQGILSTEEAQWIEIEQITAFFRTEPGKKLCEEREILREFKFSILDDASQYSTGVPEEKVLLQGVVDCAIVEPDGIIIIDFKTDRVTEKTLPDVTERYRSQVDAYCRAMSRIFEKKVKTAYLYFFYMDRLVEM